MNTNDDDLFGAEHVRVYRETGGERGYHWRGATILLLTTTGRRSGEERTTPLIHRTDGERWVVVASKGGYDEHPGWFLNLSDDPQIEIQVKADEEHEQHQAHLGKHAQGSDHLCGEHVIEGTGP